MKTLIFDTETTALITNSIIRLEKQPRIIEFFGLILDGEEEKESFHFLFNPGELISEDTTKITGITNFDVKDKPKFSDRYEWIGSFLELQEEVVAHNLSYDQRVIDFEMKRNGVTLSWPKKICTVEATEHLLGYRLSLMALHEHLFGVPFDGAHRAENDVRATARCFIELRKRGIV